MSASSTKEPEIDFSKLRFVRIFTPVHIPKELIEQVREKEYDVNDWYRYLEIVCIRQTNEGPQLNPLCLLYVIVDELNKVVGMLWAEIDTLSKILAIQTFSMDKKYWLKGQAVTLLADKAKEIAKECGLKKIRWASSYPKHSERYGFHRSKSVLMEWIVEDNKESQDGFDIAGQREVSGVSALDDQGATGVSQSVVTGTWGASQPGSEPVSAAI